METLIDHELVHVMTGANCAACDLALERHDQGTPDGTSDEVLNGARLDERFNRRLSEKAGITRADRPERNLDDSFHIAALSPPHIWLDLIHGLEYRSDPAAEESVARS